MTRIEKNITRYNSKTGFYVEVDESERDKGWKTFYIGHVKYTVKCGMISCEVRTKDIDNFIASYLWEWISYYIEEIIKDDWFLEDDHEMKEANEE